LTKFLSINPLENCSNTFKNGDENLFTFEGFLPISEIYGFVQIPGILGILFIFQATLMSKKLFIHNLKLIGQLIASRMIYLNFFKAFKR
jgi:hypothetical protein